MLLARAGAGVLVRSTETTPPLALDAPTGTFAIEQKRSEYLRWNGSRNSNPPPTNLARSKAAPMKMASISPDLSKVTLIPVPVIMKLVLTVRHVKGRHSIAHSGGFSAWLIFGDDKCRFRRATVEANLDVFKHCSKFWDTWNFEQSTTLSAPVVGFNVVSIPRFCKQCGTYVGSDKTNREGWKVNERVIPK